MLGLLAAILCSLGCAGCARRIFPSLRLMHPSLGFGLAGLLGLGLLGAATLPLGLPEGGFRIGIGLPIVVTIVGLIFLAQDRSWLPKSKPEGAELLALLALGLGGLFVLTGVLAPSTSIDWDSLAYHLAVPKLWNQAGKYEFISFIHHSNFPFAIDNLFIWGLQFGGEAGAKAFSFCLFVFGAFAIFGIASDFYGRAAGWWAAVTFSTMPVVLWLAGTAYIDVANGTFAGLGILLAARACTAVSAKPYAVAAAWTLGFAAGSKYTGIQTILVVGLCILGFSVAKRTWRKELILIPILAAVIASPWYIRNIVQTGNPVYPFFYSVLGGKNWSPFAATIYSNEQQTFGAGRELPTQDQPNYTANALEPSRFPHAVLGLAYQSGRYINPAPIQGLGFIWGSLGILGLLGGLLRLSSGKLSAEEKFALAAVGLSLAMWFFLSQQSRYIIALSVPLCVIGAGVIVRGAIGRILAGVAVLQTAYGLYLVSGQLVQDRIPVLTGQISPDEYRAARIPFFTPAQELNKLPAGSKVALYDEVFGYLLDIPYFWANPGHTTELGYDKMTSGEELIENLQKLNITHVYMDLGPIRRDNPGLFEQWTRAAGLAQPAAPFPPEVRRQLLNDEGSRWRVFLADSIAKGQLRLTWSKGTRLIFEIAR